MYLLLLFIFSYKALAGIQDSCHKSFQILGAPVHQGQSHKEVAEAYNYLEKQGFWSQFPLSHQLLSQAKKPFLLYSALFEETSHIAKNHRPAIIGGDHSQSFATVSAMLNTYPDLKVIWFDAHADLHTPKTSPTGNSHGMPLGALMGLAGKSEWNMPWLNQSLLPESLIYLGLRDMEPEEAKAIHSLNITAYSPKQIRQKGLKNLLSTIAHRWKNSPVHLSFDIDGLDPLLVPGTGTPSPEGMTMEEALQIIEWAKTDVSLVSFDFVEFNPHLAKTPKERETTEQNVKRLLKAFLSLE